MKSFDIYEEFNENTFNVKEVENLTINTISIMKEKFDFITSLRFWSLVIGAVMFYLNSKGIVGEQEMILVNTILGGFITLKTIDRASEQKVLAAKEAGAVTTVSMPSNVNTVTATTE